MQDSQEMAALSGGSNPGEPGGMGVGGSRGASVRLESHSFDATGANFNSEELTLSSDSAHTSVSSSRASSQRDDGDDEPLRSIEREIGTQTSLNANAVPVGGLASGSVSPFGSPRADGNGKGLPSHFEDLGLSGAEERERALIEERVRDSRSGSQTSSSGGDSEEFYVNNPTPQIIPPPVETGAVGEKHVIVMVGLPARGKTHMARRLARYLAFFHGARTKVFNVGEYRRKNLSNKQCNSDFFDHNVEKNKQLRASFAKMAMDDMIQFLFEDRAQQQIIKVESMENMSLNAMGAGMGGASNGDNGGNGAMGGPHGQSLRSRSDFYQQKGVDSGKVAFFDATNTTKARRKWICSQLEGLPLKIIFIESICTDEATIEKNIWDAKVTLPDYEHLKKKRDKAYADFKQRIANYEKVYQKVDEDNLSWVKLINNGQKVVINRIHGFLPMKMVQFLTNIHAFPHSFYLSRHGQSEYNKFLKIGGDSGLTELGEQYALDLAKFAEEQICTCEETGKPRTARLWTSSLVRTVQTARHIPHPMIKDPSTGRKEWIQMDHRIYRNLDELYAGVCDGMTYEEIEQMYPDDFKRRNEDKFNYRYPRGESYLDILSRLDPLVMEMESYREPLLIVGHQAVLRLIYGYFTGKRREDCPRLSIPLNTVIKLTPRTYDCEEERIGLSNIISQDDGQREPPSH
uniref:6-phosphofructo-2-kinase domain-containing protein n=2 Tax=Eukaryota TaxID=2759 RepID=A0A7S2Z5F9_9CHLO|mmetsp:Transcript_5710/g.14778  ORF Transcript_5710/g.14778 Transcript_5710/m.14778 type:complete len:687 (+) Transcript_5710:408-2468(+)